MCFNWNTSVIFHTKRKGRLSPEQTNTKVNCELLSRYRYYGHATRSPNSCRQRGRKFTLPLSGNIIQFIFILVHCFPTWVPRNPSVAHNIIRRSTRNSGINEHRFCNTATSSKYPTKYRGKFCPSIGNTGVIPVRCQLCQFLYRSVRI